MLLMLFMWAIYSGLTIFGMLRYPYYSAIDKSLAFLKILLLPFIGSYLVNRDMGFRLSEESKRDLLYELPWWSTLGTRSSTADIDDD